MRYAAGLDFPDPTFWAQTTDGRTHLLMGPLEYAAERDKTAVDVVHPFPSMKEVPEDERPLYPFKFLLEQAAWPARIEVPAHFPARAFSLMKEAGWPVEAVPAPFFPTRAVKTADEIEKLRDAQHANQHGFGRLREVLGEATIGTDAVLIWRGDILTAEILRAEMQKEQLNHSCVGFNGGPIIGCGAQGACPHERGHGALYAHQLIVVDSFPLHANGYNGDLTRTFLKGTPLDWQVALVAAVTDAQQAALNMLKAGVNGKEVHQHGADILKEKGFDTGTLGDGTPYGFFHGTGHGVGLEVHDYPAGTIAGRDITLEAGMVTSVEPGLYYPPGTHEGGVGGCRIEDVVAITENGVDNLTTLTTGDWVID